MEVRLRCLRNYSRREIFCVAFCESTVNGVAVSLSDSLHESIVSVRTDGKRALVGRIRRVKNVMGCGRIAKNMINN